MATPRSAPSAGWGSVLVMSNWQRSPESATTGASRGHELDELPPQRPDGRLPAWIGPLAAFLAGLALILILVTATDLFDAGQSEAERATAYDAGFADGAGQARTDFERELAAREAEAFARGRADPDPGLLRTAAERGATAVRAVTLNLASESYNNGFADGYRFGLRDGISGERSFDTILRP